MHFLRLLRPVNLLVIVLTMYGIRLFFLPYLPKGIDKGESFDYFLLVFSTVIIAAGGNIINDYFDVKADRINKPEKLIIGKYIKPRWAIVSHWIFNFSAFAIACYLSWRYATFWYVFIHLMSINALWFYSMYFKRRFLIGNLIISLLTGLVPILCGIHFLHLTIPADQLNIIQQWTQNEQSWISSLNLKIFFVLFFAFFASSLNLVREIIKDMEDVKGDEVLKAKTLAIVLGLPKSKWISVILLVGILSITFPFVLEAFHVYGSYLLKAMAPAVGIVICIVSVIFILFGELTNKRLKTADLILKIAMFIGSFLPFYWYFL